MPIMLTPAKDKQIKAVHASYVAALGTGDLAAVAEQFTFPAAFKGFLDDVVIATDAIAVVNKANGRPSHRRCVQRRLV